MRRMELNKGLAIALSALMLLVATAGAASSSSLAPARPVSEDVTHFGGDEFRNHYSGEPWGTGLCALIALDLGKSSSQPLMIGNRVYHLAGDSLWALKIDQQLPSNLNPDEALQAVLVWRRAGLQAGKTDSSPVFVDREVNGADGLLHRGIIYAITGAVPGSAQRSIIAVAADDGTLLGRQLLPAVDIITSPLVFPNDVVVFGTTDGYLMSVAGLTKIGEQPVPNKQFVGGIISGSFVPVGPDTFLVSFDDWNGKGAVMKFGLDLKPRWLNADGTPKYHEVPYGAKASLALDGIGTAYFAAASGDTGYFFAIDGDSGNRKWTSIVFSEDAMFVNNSPALDAEYAYFTVKRSTGGVGRLIAFKRNGPAFQTPAWQATLPGMGTTAPLVWGDAGAVLVGDTGGRVTAWRAPRPGEPEGVGQPVPFATQMSCDQIGHLKSFWEQVGGAGDELLQSELLLTDSPFQDDKWWSNKSGASTELTLAHGMLLSGANGASGQDVFLAFRPGIYHDIELKGSILGSDQIPFEPGQIREASMYVAYTGSRPIRTMIVHGWAGGMPLFEFVDLAPGDKRWLTVKTPPVPEGAAVYHAIVNPLGYDFHRRGDIKIFLEPLPSVWEPFIYGAKPLPAAVRAGFERMDAIGTAVVYEVDPTNNRWQQNVAIAAPIDLQFLAITAPATIPAPVPPAEPWYPLTANIRNTGDTPVDTVLRLTVQSQAMNGQSMVRKVHLEPGDNTITVQMPGSNDGDTITVVATINPDHTIAEETYQNNSRMAVTQVLQSPEAALPPGDWGKVNDWLTKP